MKPNFYSSSFRINISILALFIFFASGLTAFGQNTAITDVDGYSPNASAVLDVNSTTKGFLLPRLTAAQMAAIASPSFGLMVFNTTDNNVYYYNGASWLNFLSLGVSSLRSPNGTYTNAIVIDNNGRVGLSQATPLARLHINPYGTGADSHIRLEFSATEFGNIYYDAQGMKLRTRGAGDYFSFINSLGNTNVVMWENGKVGIGDSWPTARLGVKGDNSIALDSALFEVKSKGGQTIFAVYEEGVRIYVPDANMKGAKAGFAVGGRTPGKAGTVNYMVVTPDSVRIWVPDTSAKGAKGGFSVGGRTPGAKGISNPIMNITKQNYFIGHQSGINTTGLYNAFLGYQTGMDNTTGFGDVLIGYQAGTNNTVGSYNAFLGFQSGFLNTIGSYNSFYGYKSEYSNSSGSYNTFYGNEAGKNNTSAQYNTLIGYQAGYSNSIANYITAVGYQAGYSLTDWQAGVYVGYMAGKLNTGRTNTFIGEYSGTGCTTGYDNVFLGGGSGGDVDNTATFETGSGNVYIGKYSGWMYRGGSNNVYIGNNSGNAATGSGNIFIGPNVGASNINSNQLLIDNAGGNASTALIAGDFTAKTLIFNANLSVGAVNNASKIFGYDNTLSSDVPALYGQHDVTDNYGVGVYGKGGYKGVSALNNSTTGYDYGVYSIANGSGSGNRYGVYASASGGTTNYGIYAYASGGTAYAGFFSGNLTYTGSLTLYSDENLKTNIKTLDNSLNKLLTLRGVTYSWKKENLLQVKSASNGKEQEAKSKYNFPEGEQVGVIAQEVEKVFPDLVFTDADGIKSVDYLKLTPVMIEAIKEQQKLIEALTKRIERLEQVSK